jgi:hypothetical protein
LYEIPRLFGRKLTDAGLAALGISTSPITIDLSYETSERLDRLHRCALVVTITNQSPKTISNWSVQLEVPPPLVAQPKTNGTYRPEMSNPTRDVFRTSDSFGESRPLWHTQEYQYKIGFESIESHQSLLDKVVVARGYVGGALMSERRKPVRELTDFFAVVFVARRRALDGIQDSIARAIEPPPTAKKP